MTLTRTRLFVVAALLALGTPAATLAREPAPGMPRSPWAERYYEVRQGPEHTDRFTGNYRVEGDGALDLTQISGDVRVTTIRGGEIRIEAVKRVRHREDGEARRLLDALRVEVTHTGNRVEVRTVYPRGTDNRRWNGSVDYTIGVPANTAVAIKTVSGDLSIHGVRGEVRAETVSGDVEVIGTPNLAVAKTVSGDVTARDIAATTLALGTVSGSVIASALKVRTLDASSVSGDLQLSRLEVERLTAKTVSGTIAFDGELDRGGRYEFNAHSGDIRLTIAPNTPGFELDASTFSGSIRADFPITLRSSASPDRGRGANRAIRGTFGDAGAILAVRSFSGSVVIARR